MVELKRLEKQYVVACEFLEKVKKMNNCHIVTHPLRTVDHDEVSFYNSSGGFCHGLGAAGDWTSGFDKIKEGLVEYAEDYKKELEETLSQPSAVSQQIQEELKEHHYHAAKLSSCTEEELFQHEDKEQLEAWFEAGYKACLSRLGKES